MIEKNNSGDRNSGHRNSGHRNSGYYNSGNYNSGNRNSGNYNSGNYNSGDYNSGYHNSGDYNSGNRNSGNYNSGDYNSGDYNSGFFCTYIPRPTFFDQPVDMSWDGAAALIPHVDLPVGCEWVSTGDMSDDEKETNPNYETIGGYLKSHDLPLNEAFPVAWEKLDDETRQRFLDLPNFDAEKFLTITGVDVRKVVTPATTTDNLITIYGKQFRLVPVES